MDSKRESFSMFFVTENKDANYKTTNNTNTWPSGSSCYPASPVTAYTGLTPISGKRTANRDIRHNTSGSLSSGDDENDSSSEDDGIMSPPNLSKRKATDASLQQGLCRAKARLNGAKMEVKQYKKQYDQAARQVLVLKTVLNNARAETKDP
jgi:hypothetical protein